MKKNVSVLIDNSKKDDLSRNHTGSYWQMSFLPFIIVQVKVFQPSSQEAWADLSQEAGWWVAVDQLHNINDDPCACKPSLASQLSKQFKKSF